MKVAERMRRPKATGFPCPSCGSPAWCIDSRVSPAGWRRRRGCNKCGLRFSTYEVAAEAGKGFMAEITAMQMAVQNAMASMEDLEAILELAKKAESIQESYRALRNGELSQVLWTPGSGTQGAIG